ncbi:hypothetical protein LTR57_012189 [Friedmanniomyces endolithicus]|nr:hypothetical protein LTR57_012189 [Friedmanniomyces endolithicus]
MTSSLPHERRIQYARQADSDGTDGGWVFKLGRAGKNDGAGEAEELEGVLKSELLTGERATVGGLDLSGQVSMMEAYLFLYNDLHTKIKTPQSDSTRDNRRYRPSSRDSTARIDPETQTCSRYTEDLPVNEPDPRAHFEYGRHASKEGYYTGANADGEEIGDHLAGEGEHGEVKQGESKRGQKGRVVNVESRAAQGVLAGAEDTAVWCCLICGKGAGWFGFREGRDGAVDAGDGEVLHGHGHNRKEAGDHYGNAGRCRVDQCDDQWSCELAKQVNTPHLRVQLSKMAFIVAGDDDDPVALNGDGVNDGRQLFDRGEKAENS